MASSSSTAASAYSDSSSLASSESFCTRIKQRLVDDVWNPKDSTFEVGSTSGLPEESTPPCWADGKLPHLEYNATIKNEQQKEKGKQKTSGLTEESTPHCWADDIKPLVVYDPMINDPDYYRAIIKILRRRLHSPTGSDDLGSDDLGKDKDKDKDMLITTSNLKSLFRIDIPVVENTVRLVINAADLYIVTFKSRDVWFVFYTEPSPQRSGENHTCPPIPGSVTLPFKESYPDMVKHSRLDDHELLKFQPYFIENAVYDLMKSEKSPEFATSIFQLTSAFPEGIRLIPVENTIASSFKIECQFGPYNAALVHLWSILSRVYIFRGRFQIDKMRLSEAEINFLVGFAKKTIGILKRNTERQGTDSSVWSLSKQIVKQFAGTNEKLHYVLNAVPQEVLNAERVPQEEVPQEVLNAVIEEVGEKLKIEQGLDLDLEMLLMDCAKEVLSE